MANVHTATQQLEQQQGGQVERKQPTVSDLVNQMRPAIERALPKAMDADRFTRIVLTTVRTNPTLASCNPQSLLAACMLSAQLGLEPGPLGHAYLVPFGREVTFIIGYRGMLDLARRSGDIESIEAREVCANDRFEYEFGLEPKLKHVPASGDRGEPVYYYGIAKFTSGGHFFEVLSKADVDSYKERSRAKGNGPWVTDYSAMAKKTVVRRMAPYLPLSAEAARAVASDEGVVARLDELGDDDTDVTVSHDDDPITVTNTVREDGEPSIDDLRKPQLVKRLHAAGLDTEGKVDVLRERWRKHVEGSPQGGSPAPDGDGPQEESSPGEGPSAAGTPHPEPAAEDASSADDPPDEEVPDAVEENASDDATGEDEPEPSSPDGPDETWQEHADRLGVKTVQLLNELRGRWPANQGWDMPTNRKKIEAAYQGSAENAQRIHEAIEAAGGEGS